jgi:Tol biopolymer transport system component
VKDRRDGSVVRANVPRGGVQDGGGTIPAYANALDETGTRIVFASFAGLVPGTGCMGEQVYMRRFDQSRTIRVSDGAAGECGDSWSNYPSISTDGRFVTWTSFAGNLVSGDTNNAPDVFRRGTF